MTHQTLSLEKYWKLFPATLRTDANASSRRHAQVTLGGPSGLASATDRLYILANQSISQSVSQSFS